MIFAGLPDRFESEGVDRSDMKMPEGHLRLIQAVSKANPDTVVVLLCGRAADRDSPSDSGIEGFSENLSETAGEQKGCLSVKGEKIKVPAWQKGFWYETCQGRPDQKEWEAMLGHRYQPTVLKKGQFTMDNTVEEMKEYSFIMKIMYKAVEATVAKGFGGKKDYENPEFRMMMASSAGSPLRSMQISGGMKDGLMQGLLEMANGHFLKGIRRMIKDIS